MTEQLISSQTAILALEKGFNIPCINFYTDKYGLCKYGEETLIVHEHPETKECEVIYDVNSEFNIGKKYYAPTQSLLAKWLREVHNLHLYIDTTPSFEQTESHKSKYKASVKVPFNPFKWTTGHYYLGNTYEEALEKGLYQALLLIK